MAFAERKVSPDLLESNYPPLDSDISQIRNIIFHGRAEITSLDATIAVLRDVLERVVHKRTALETHIRTHEGAISALRHMPPELLALIFRAVARPWTLVLVCRRWREIAMSEQALWTRVEICNSIPSVAALEAQLKRAGQLPLDITVEFFGAVRCSEPELELLGVLGKSSERWESFTYSGSGHICTVLQAIRDCFEIAPNLRDVFLGLDGHPSIPLPFGQLTRFRGEDLDCFFTHPAPVNLVECALRVGQSLGFSSIVSLPHLLRFSLSPPSVLQYFHAPLLEELYCDPGNWSDDIATYSSDILSFMNRVPCKLRKLVLDFSGVVVGPDFEHIARAVPTVTTLGLTLPDPYTPSNVVLSLLALPDSTILPVLRSFLINIGGRDLLGACLDILESRSRGRSVTLHDMSPRAIPSDLLATNRPPLGPETTDIQSIIAEERARKTHLDAQIAALQSSLEMLMHGRSMLEAEIHKHEGTLSPHRRMSTELLSLIFIFTHIHDKDPAPWKIGQVQSQAESERYLKVAWSKISSDRWNQVVFFPPSTRLAELNITRSQ
ncbi:hypothetical protein C8R43DRAFT_1129042 [Mycena crocata]|nr:hypothetical protein C8R43DRAFT_1129042 [Mycena crocata]